MSKFIQVVVNESDKEEIDEAAKKSGLSSSSFLRMAGKERINAEKERKTIAKQEESK